MECEDAIRFISLVDSLDSLRSKPVGESPSPLSEAKHCKNIYINKGRHSGEEGSAAPAVTFFPSCRNYVVRGPGQTRTRESGRRKCNLMRMNVITREYATSIARRRAALHIGLEITTSLHFIAAVRAAALQGSYRATYRSTSGARQ